MIDSCTPLMPRTRPVYHIFEDCQVGRVMFVMPLLLLLCRGVGADCGGDAEAQARRD